MKVTIDEVEVRKIVAEHLGVHGFFVKPEDLKIEYYRGDEGTDFDGFSFELEKAVRTTDYLSF